MYDEVLYRLFNLSPNRNDLDVKLDRGSLDEAYNRIMSRINSSPKKDFPGAKLAIDVIRSAYELLLDPETELAYRLYGSSGVEYEFNTFEITAASDFLYYLDHYDSIKLEKINPVSDSVEVSATLPDAIEEASPSVAATDCSGIASEKKKKEKTSDFESSLSMKTVSHLLDACSSTANTSGDEHKQVSETISNLPSEEDPLSIHSSMADKCSVPVVVKPEPISPRPSSSRCQSIGVQLTPESQKLFASESVRKAPAPPRNPVVRCASEVSPIVTLDTESSSDDSDGEFFPEDIFGESYSSGSQREAKPPLVYMDGQFYELSEADLPPSLQSMRQASSVSLDKRSGTACGQESINGPVSGGSSCVTSSSSEPSASESPESPPDLVGPTTNRNQSSNLVRDSASSSRRFEPPVSREIAAILRHETRRNTLKFYVRFNSVIEGWVFPAEMLEHSSLLREYLLKLKLTSRRKYIYLVSKYDFLRELFD